LSETPYMNTFDTRTIDIVLTLADHQDKSFTLLALLETFDKNTLKRFHT